MKPNIDVRTHFLILIILGFGQVAIADSKLGFELSYQRFYYREELKSPARSIENGAIPRLDIRYDRPVLSNKAIIHTHLITANGSTAYDGSSQSIAADGSATIKPLADESKAFRFGGEIGISTNLLTLGQDSSSFEREASFEDGALQTSVLWPRKMELRPFAGISYDFWYRGGSEHPGSYSELYRWLTLSFGLELKQPITDTIQFRWTSSARPVMGGTVEAYFSEVDSRIDDSVVSVGSRLGFESRLSIEAALSKTLSAQLTPWINTYGFSRSDSVALKTKSGGQVLIDKDTPMVVAEPSSRTYEAGLGVGLSAFF